MRGKGEGAVYRVPKDRSLPLKYWVAVKELPRHHDGTRRRLSKRAKSKAVALEKLEKAAADLKLRGDLPTAGQTNEQWFSYWLDNIAAREVRPNTLSGYRGVVTLYVTPVIGKVRLEQTTAAHVRRVTDAMLSAGKSSTYAQQAHRVMSVAYEAATREGRMGRNPAKLTPAPRKAVVEMEAFTLPEAVAVLEHVLRRPDGARWATALLTGARRGEIIGLERDRINDVIDISWQMQRLKLSPDGTPLVPADYECRHLRGGLYLTRPKSRRGWRVVPLVDPLKSLLEAHLAAAPDNRYGLAFVRPDGHPIDPDQDSRMWRDVLAETGIDRDVSLHGLRHTAADLLYAAGVPEDLIQEILGHSTRVITRGYKTRGDGQRLLTAMETFSAGFLTPPAEGTHQIAAG